MLGAVAKGVGGEEGGGRGGGRWVQLRRSLPVLRSALETIRSITS